MANNVLSDIIRIKDLRQRIIFTFALLLVARIGTIITVPGIDSAALVAHNTLKSTTSGGVNWEDYLDFFAGGAFKNASIFMAGIMPYITVSIIINMLVLVFPSMKKAMQEEGGRKKVQRWTRYGTVFMTIFQGLQFLNGLVGKGDPQIVTIGTVPFLVLGCITLVAGTMILVWLGEQITQRGIGNGISLILFVGIIARMPSAIIQLLEQVSLQNVSPVALLFVLVMFIVVVALVIYEQQGQRKIPVHYAKRIVGRRMSQGGNVYIPMKINPSGVIPVIFASSLLTLPVSILAGFAKGNAIITELSVNFPGALLLI